MVSIMRRAEVLAATGLCYTSIYNMEKRGDFPARKKLTGIGRSVGWIRSEVEAWINNLTSACTASEPIAPSSKHCDPLANIEVPANWM